MRASNVAVVKQLLEWRVDLEKKNQHGWTALYLAALVGRNAIISMLIDARADVEAKAK